MKLAEELDKKVRGYIKKTLKQGYSKKQIRDSLRRVGYDIGIINKSFKDISRQRTTNILLTLLVIVLVVGLFVFLKYYLKPEPLEFLIEQPKEKFTASNKSILLMSWGLPLEAKQNELVNLTTVWKSQRYVNKDYGTIFFLFNKEGDNVAKYFFSSNSYPTSSRNPGYQYLETYSLNVPYLKPDTYYYKIGLWDMFENKFFYAYAGTVLGNLTIKENPNIKPCGLIIFFIAPSSPAEKAGVKVGGVIIGINGQRLEFENVKAESKFPRSLFADKVISLREYELNTENKTYKIVKESGEKTGLRFRYKLCNI